MKNIDLDIKGVQLGCKNPDCDSTEFVQFINFDAEVIASFCAKCSWRHFLVPLSHKETLRFQKDYLEQELEKKV